MCRRFDPPEGFVPSRLQEILSSSDASYLREEDSVEMRRLIPFQACGDLQGWDADATYALPSESYELLPPVQPPTAPPYKEALDRIRGTSSKRGEKSLLEK